MKRIIFTLCMLVGFSASSTLPMAWYDRYDQMCPIEREMKHPDQLTRLGCWHRHCTDCLGDRIVQAIQDRNVRQLRCPERNCNHRLTDEELGRLNLDADVLERYQQLQNDLREAAVRIRAEGITFEKRKMIWNASNTDACPECYTLIQKNGGCIHMTCRQEVGGCGHEFCWVCLANWPGHRFCSPVSAAKVRLLRTHPGYTAIKLVVLAGASYGAYRLYKYFYPCTEEAVPAQPAVVPDLKISMENLHKEAMKARNQLVSANGYIRASFKNYFDLQVAQNAFKDLDAAKMIELQKIVDDLEKGLVAGVCDTHYNALINFIIALDAKNTPIAPVVIPSPAQEIPAKTVAPAKKPSKRVMHKKRQTRKVK